MPIIALLNTNSLPCPGTHYFHTKRFLSGFKSHGFTYLEISDDTNLLNLGKDDLIYISNHGLSENSHIELLQVKKSGAIPIFWYAHNQIRMISEIFGTRFILTGEHFRKKPALEPHLSFWNLQNELTNYVPLTFASDLAKEKIGSMSRHDKYSAHFIGNGYKRSWNIGLRIAIPRTIIINTPPFLPEPRRREIFLSSKVALGWHSKQNISNHVLVERIFEGLAFGNVVVSDHPDAQDATDGIVEYSSNFLQAAELIQKSNRDNSFSSRKQELGYAFARSHGTYDQIALNFVKAIMAL